jgi:hypothetical protein
VVPGIAWLYSTVSLPPSSVRPGKAVAWGVSASPRHTSQQDLDNARSHAAPPIRASMRRIWGTRRTQLLATWRCLSAANSWRARVTTARCGSRRWMSSFCGFHSGTTSNYRARQPSNSRIGPRPDCFGTAYEHEKNSSCSTTRTLAKHLLREASGVYLGHSRCVTDMYYVGHEFFALNSSLLSTVRCRLGVSFRQDHDERPNACDWPTA